MIAPEYNNFCTKVAFFRIPKNASTSIYDHLGYANLLRIHIEELSKKVDKKTYRGLFDCSDVKPDEFKDLVIGENLKNYFSFCVVRNPWDRVVSLYHYWLKNEDLVRKTFQIKAEFTFDLFCQTLKDQKENPNFTASHAQSRWTEGKYPPKMILRFENINEEFSKMVKKINLITVSTELPHKNKTEHKHYSEYYNTKTKKIISSVFEEDIDKFKYIFTEEYRCSGESKGQGGSLRI